MNLLNFYRLLPLAPLAINVCLTPYRWYRTKSTSDKQWDLKNPLDNFTLLSQHTPKTLAGRACPGASYASYQWVPYLHQGNLKTQNKKEADTLINHAIDIASIASGAIIAAIPVMKFFKKCLETQGLGTCIYTGSSDFLSTSGIHLLVGTYLISRIAKYALIQPIAALFTQDRRHLLRRDLIANQYTQMTNAINALFDKPSDDPLVLKTVSTVKQFLHIAPHIEKELHTGLALDPEEAIEILNPLKAACRHLLVHAAQKTIDPKKAP